MIIYTLLYTYKIIARYVAFFSGVWVQSPTSCSLGGSVWNHWFFLNCSGMSNGQDMPPWIWEQNSLSKLTVMFNWTQVSMMNWEHAITHLHVNICFWNGLSLKLGQWQEAANCICISFHFSPFKAKSISIVSPPSPWRLSLRSCLTFCRLASSSLTKSEVSTSKKSSLASHAKKN